MISSSNAKVAVICVIAVSTALSACGFNQEENQQSHNFRFIIQDSFNRQATAENLSVESVKRRQRAVVFDGPKETCILLTEGDIAGSQRCYVRRGSDWLVVSEAIALKE